MTYIAHIFNHIVTTASFSQKRKIANKIPDVKKTSPADPADPADYRPVSILSALSKPFERLICKQILTHMRNNFLLFYRNINQAFRLPKVLEDLRAAFDRGDLSVLVLIDFSKAFDSVSFEK